MRQWPLPALLLLATSCASIQAPPGGPEDKLAPELVAVRPDSLIVGGAFDEPVVFAFSERIAERGVEDAVLVSPRTSPVQVSHRGDEIRVALRRGWEAGRIYQVTVLPGLLDLFGNRIVAPLSLVFSTGPEIPDTRLTGAVVDRITGKAEFGTRVEAIRSADSLVYALPTDSAGRFEFRRIPAGEYRVRAYRDLNRNRVLEPYEARDTAAATVVVGATPEVALRVVDPDTTAPVVASARPAAGSTVEVLVDDYLDPTQPLAPEQVRITGPGGEIVPVARVAVGSLPAADTVVVDTLAAVDTVAAVDTLAVDSLAAPPEVADSLPGEPAAETPAAENLPSQTLTIQPAAPLTPGAEYRIIVRGVRNVVGLVGGGETTFTPPAEQPAAEQPETRRPAETEPPPGAPSAAGPP